MARAQSLGGASTTSPTPSHSETRQVRKSRTITTSTEAMDLALSPESGSGNESAPGSEQQDEPQSPDGSTGHGSVQAGHGDEDMSASTQTQMPVQKRRRVTRACDECRRKKIKCDGKQPCTHCSVYSYGEDIINLVSRIFTLMVLILQNVRMINHPTGGATQRHNTSRRWRTSWPAQRLYFANSYQKST